MYTPINEMTNGNKENLQGNVELISHSETELKKLDDLNAEVVCLRQKYEEELAYYKETGQLLQESLDKNNQYLDEALLLTKETIKGKTLFTNEISRELRGLIHSVLGFSYIFDTSNLDNVQQDQMAKIYFSANSLLQITNYIIDYTNFENDNIKLDNIPFFVDELIENLVHYFHSTLYDKNINLIIKKDEDLPKVIIGDPPRIYQIMQNLLDNAIEVTETGDIIFEVTQSAPISISKHSDKAYASLCFKIRDNSRVNVTTNEIETLLSLHTFSSFEMNDYFKGSRIGFEVTKNLIDLIGGNISIIPLNTGGAEFIVNFVFEVVSYDEDVEKVFVGKHVEIDSSIKALVVDDNQVNREVSKALLKKLNIEVDAVSSGYVALEKIKENSYNFIFLDIQMPEMDGYELSHRIRHIENIDEYATDVNNVPIIAMTANALAQDYVKSREAGMNEHITKPISPQRLEEVVQAWINHCKPQNI